MSAPLESATREVQEIISTIPIMSDFDNLSWKIIKHIIAVIALLEANNAVLMPQLMPALPQTE